MEVGMRKTLEGIPATQWRKRSNHFMFGKIPAFTPMFHQVDARVEMIRSQLDEAIIVVPRWPAEEITTGIAGGVPTQLGEGTPGEGE